jgi:glycerol kinase
LANLLNFNIERSNFSYTSSSTGAAFLAGLGSNVFTKLDQLSSMRQVTDIFKPNESFESYEYEISQWEKALKRFFNWYTPT